jgi:alcohol dehydrogenase
MKNGLGFVLPTKVTFGSGSLVALGEQVTCSGFKRIAFITTKQLIDLNLTEKAAEITHRNGAQTFVYGKAKDNPTIELVANTVKELESFGPDCLIGFGGGSAIDLAKAVGICLGNSTCDVRVLQQKANINNSSIPVICIPTTSGTGSEVNYWAVISDSCTKEKISIGDPRMAPHMAIVDPELTLTLPPQISLWTGLDALTHALEAYVSVLSSRLSDLLALEALKLNFENLDQVFEHGDDLEAREGMAMASLLAGAAMQQVGLGLVHAMSHQISGFYNTPHGLVNAKLLGSVYDFNLPKIGKEKCSILDSLIGKPFRQVLTDISNKYSLANRLIILRESDLRIMSQRAATNVNAKTNPRDASVEEIESLYRLAFTVS